MDTVMFEDNSPDYIFSQILYFPTNCNCLIHKFSFISQQRVHVVINIRDVVSIMHQEILEAEVTKPFLDP